MRWVGEPSPPEQAADTAGDRAAAGDDLARLVEALPPPGRVRRRCPDCGYDLRGCELATPVCPECGADFFRANARRQRGIRLTPGSGLALLMVLAVTTGALDGWQDWMWRVRWFDLSRFVWFFAWLSRLAEVVLAHIWALELVQAEESLRPWPRPWRAAGKVILLTLGVVAQVLAVDLLTRAMFRL